MMRLRILAVATSLLVVMTTAPAQAASPKISLGVAQSNGSAINLALTSKYKSKVVTIEYGIKSGKKFKYSKLTTARLDTRGNAAVCTLKKLATTGMLQVKVGSKVVASTKVSGRTRIAGCAIAVPSSLALTTSSDSGSSQSDAITNATNIDITGRALAGSSVSIALNGTPSATCTTANTGTFTCAMPANLAEGNYSVTSIATLGRSVSTQSAPFTMKVDRTAPTINCQWLENEIGLNAIVHIDCTPNEAINGFESSDLIVPNGLDNGELEFAPAQTTQTGYRVEIAANSYNTTDLLLLLREGTFADLAGNDFYATNYSSFLGYRYTATSYLHLDLEGPRIESTSLEEITTPMLHGKLTFTFDEVVQRAQLADFEIAYYLASQFGISRLGSNSLTSISTDGVLHTDDNKTFWVFITVLDYFNFVAFANSYTLAAVSYGITDITDEYGNPVDTGYEGQLGDWAY